jgi:hypothetical protein
LKKYHRTIIAVRGDTQGGHAGGLLNPETLIPDWDIDEAGQRVITGWRHIEPRPVQKQLWRWHEQDMANVRTLAGKDEIVFLEMGDLTQGGIFKDDLDENGLNTQVVISRWNCTPWLDLPNVQRMYIVKGTGVHVWGEAATETLLTAQLKAEYPKKSVKINDHWILDLDGFLIDMAHHGPGAGIRNWTRGNVFELYCKSILRDSIDMAEPIPHVILRGHKHEFIYRPVTHQTKNKIWKADGFITPPYCFIGSHAQKVMNSPSFMGVGILALEVLDGKLYQWHPFTHYVDLRTMEVL